jgi:excisionase family DNA binding protein
MASTTPIEDAPQLLSIDETAAFLGVNRHTVYRAMERGDLAFVTVGKRRKVHRSTLDEYLRPKSAAS